MTLAIVPAKKQSLATIPRPNPEPDRESFLLAMFLTFARAPRNPNPDLDGSYSLGEIGQDAFEDQRLLRDTPYSICRGIRES